MKTQTPLRLTDEQMRKFITEGYLILKTDFSEEFHQRLFNQLNAVYTDEGNPGNNLLPRIREVQKIFDHPVITGALTSVLGPNYMMHAHRHGHYNAVSVPGGWHKDSYWGYQRIRNHHPWWVMIMYFPQDTPVDLGPTGVMPGTQHYETRTFESDDSELEAVASGAAGTFALIHYDIWHRSTANLLGNPRFMLKFEFMRTTVPAEPSWDNQASDWTAPADLHLASLPQEVLWADTWHWLQGKSCSMVNTLPNNADTVMKLGLQLQDPSEPTALQAAYKLACSGANGVQQLLKGLHDEDVSVSRVAAYGLSVAGADAVAGLMTALDDERMETVNNAAFALGELGVLAEPAVPKLVHLLETASDVVRRTVSEVLSMIGRPVEEVVSGLIRCLQDDDVQVRFMAGLSLTRLGESATASVPYLEKLLDDENRYVRAHAMEALNYIGTDAAKDILLKALLESRWCYTTTPASTFYP